MELLGHGDFAVRLSLQLSNDLRTSLLDLQSTVNDVDAYGMSDRRTFARGPLMITVREPSLASESSIRQPDIHTGSTRAEEHNRVLVPESE